VKRKPREKTISQTPSAEYGGLIGGIAELLEAARRTAARTVNALMTATYWEIGRRIVEFEQQGATRAGYGEQILSKLSHDLTARFGRGFGVDNLQRFRSFFLSYPPESIHATLSRKLPEVLPVRSQTSPWGNRHPDNPLHRFGNWVSKNTRQRRVIPHEVKLLGQVHNPKAMLSLFSTSPAPSLCHGRIMCGCSP
jgi:hypothetical protein